MRLKRRKRATRVEMLPLMDVIFLLLAFFVVSMIFMTVQRGLPVSLPASATAQVERKALPAITISADGSLHLDKVPVALEGLTDRLRLLANKPENTPSVQIFVDENVSVKILYAVMDAVRLAGIEELSLQAKAQ